MGNFDALMRRVDAMRPQHVRQIVPRVIVYKHQFNFRPTIE
jgi:hypothetical protein